MSDTFEAYESIFLKAFCAITGASKDQVAAHIATKLALYSEDDESPCDTWVFVDPQGLVEIVGWDSNSNWVMESLKFALHRALYAHYNNTSVPYDGTLPSAGSFDFWHNPMTGEMRAQGPLFG